MVDGNAGPLLLRTRKDAKVAHDLANALGRLHCVRQRILGGADAIEELVAEGRWGAADARRFAYPYGGDVGE